MERNEELIWVTVYADSTGLFSDYECNRNNLADLEFPKWVVEEWYKKDEKSFIEETSNELGIPEEECTFNIWLEDVYTADDTDGLYYFAEEKGFSAKCNNDTPAKIVNESDEVVFKGTVDECRKFGQENHWELNDELLDIKEDKE